MNKKSLKSLEDYAFFARYELETQIALSLNRLGISKTEIAVANIVGDRTVIGGKVQQTYPKRVFELRKRILLDLKNSNFDSLVEEYAYTWFNRIIALRFMELHNYFSHGFRVLSSKDGSVEPEILNNLPYVITELNLNPDVVRSLKEQNKTEELYRYVLFQQCNALSDTFTELFSKQDSYLEFLLPNNLLSQDSVIKKLEMIPEEDFLNDVEIVGWLYQYYVASNREKFRKASIYTKELIPTLSQIFTPDWIVRYMAENSVGRIWLESYPKSTLKKDMSYYIDDAKQEGNINQYIEEIRYKNVNPEDIKVIEPCCGSGHILVYVFDLLYKMYLEKGYTSKNIPALILKNNLYGLDLDKRAAQLADFSLIMKARSIDNRFFNKDRFVKPKVYEIKDSNLLLNMVPSYLNVMESLHFSEKSIKTAKYLVDSFKNAKNLGSLIKISSRDYHSLLEDIKRCKDYETPDLFENSFYNEGIDLLKDLIRVARVLYKKYDVIITNPPYVGLKKLEKEPKEYLTINYPDSKSDMFAMFMEVDYIKPNGFRAIVNPDSWMFLESYNSLRDKIIDDNLIINMIHIGMGAFDAVVQTTSCVIRNTHLSDYVGSYIRLVENEEFDNVENIIKQKNNFYTRNQKAYYKIKQEPIAYWVSEKTLDIFHDCDQFGKYGETKKGVLTGDDNRFGRFWYEVDYSKIDFSCKNHHDMVLHNKKWIPVTSGGAFRKWYGNFEWIVNLENDGYEIKNNKEHSSRLRSPEFYFRECVTWSEISSKAISIRYVPEGILFGNSGPCCFIKNNLYYYMGLLNTNVTYSLLKVLSPTLTFGPEQLKRLPVLIEDEEEVTTLVKKNIDICKEDWDEFETSFNFKRHPLI